MLKTKPTAEPKPSKSADERPADAPKDSMRETIESVVIAFVLAFLFRTFEAEAFVIPTGSMAPTLMGQHLDVVCPECGMPHQIGTQEDGGEKREWSICPNCGYARDEVQESFKGDRIIVSKFPYEFGDPERWDVAVFKYPARAKTNFIKRIVGVPNETVRIEHGNLLTKPEGVDTFTIARKPPAKLQAMLQVVHDSDHVSPKLVEGGWPQRWRPQAPLVEGSWKTSEDGKRFQTSGKAADAWLRYQHLVPSEEDWRTLENRALTSAEQGAIRPQLIGDFYAYNTGRHEDDSLGLHWVGDLAVDCELTAQTGAGEFVLELIEGGRAFQCHFDLATGKARLSIPDLPAYQPTAQTSVQGAGTHKLAFANADDQLFVWVDGKSIEFDQPTAYTGLAFQPPDARDLTPVGIGSRHAEVTLKHVRVLRDVYYIADKYDPHRPSGAMSDYQRAPSVDHHSRLPTFRQPADGQTVRLPEFREPVDFKLGKDQYLALGDNSPRSKDSRLWAEPQFYVGRELLIGKALFTYWPHALAPDWAWKVSIPFVGGKLALPFYPNFARMRFVR